ncbi:MAG TPA: MBL fold metallo-hydrolase [Cyclobacteriaceae bacterium]|nr:MBL fold metallo-hydrolase [Cyclobacteriaceae bacterium]
MRIKFLQAQHGDSAIVSFSKKNIIIDGGLADCYYNKNRNEYGELRAEIDLIKQRREVIDILILTHIDNDHICGLLKWFEMDKNALDLISTIWFNSGRVISNQSGEPVNNDLNVSISRNDSATTGVHEAIEFEDFVVKGTMWDQKIWKIGLILDNPDFKIEVVSPEPKQLEKLVREYKSKLKSTLTGSGSSDWNVDLQTIIEEESKPDFAFEEDQSIKNGSSIAFILYAESKRLLFLGDAHPSTVLNGLKTFGYDEQSPLKADFVKIAHHGSNKNTSARLLQAITSDNFFISTNGNYHGHPGKRTIARILNRNSNANIYFNYEYVRDQVFTKNDRSERSIKSIAQREFILE